MTPSSSSDAAVNNGLEPVVTDLREQIGTQQLIADWITTTTWPEDIAFLDQHWDQLTSPLAAHVLQSIQEPAGAQHLAILRLARNRDDTPTVLAILTDTETATEAVLSALDHAELDRLAALLIAIVQSLETTDRLLAQAVLADSHGHHQQAAATLDAVREASSPTEIKAWSIHLDRYATARHTSDPAFDPSGIEALKAVLTRGHDPGPAPTAA